MLSSFEESVGCRNQRATHEHTSVLDTSEGSNQEPSFARVLRIMNELLQGSSRTLNVVRRIRGIRAWIVMGGDTKTATVEPAQFVHNGIDLLRARTLQIENGFGIISRTTSIFFEDQNGRKGVRSSGFAMPAPMADGENE